MAFRSGSVSYARFRVQGGPSRADQEVLDALAAQTVEPPSVGAPPEVHAGWCGGRHVYDGSFDPGHVVFGETLLVGMRLDVNRVPADLRRAYRALAEAARTSDADGGLGRTDRREAREEAEERCRAELANGRHRRSKLVEVWWNVPERLLLAPVFSDAASTALRDLFAATFDAALLPLSAGPIAHERLDRSGRQRDYEDLKPTAFTPPPPAATSDGGRDVGEPAVLWAHAGPEPKDFLGNEFLIWLWARGELDDAVVESPNGDVALAIDRVLDMDCAWDATGKQTLRAHAPTRLPEAGAALALGKWPRKAGLIVAARGEQAELSLHGDRFTVSGGKLAKPEEPPATPREATELRLASIETLDRALLDTYHAFLDDRTGAAWTAQRGRIREWIRGRGRRSGGDGSAAERTAGNVETSKRRNVETGV